MSEQSSMLYEGLAGLERVCAKLVASADHVHGDLSQPGPRAMQASRFDTAALLFRDAEIGIIAPQLAELMAAAAPSFDSNAATVERDLFPVKVACLSFVQPIDAVLPGGAVVFHVSHHGGHGDGEGEMVAISQVAWIVVEGGVMTIARTRTGAMIQYLSRFGDPWIEMDTTPEPEHYSVAHTMAAVCTLLGQRVISRSAEAMPRPQARRLQREHGRDAAVVVYRLRRSVERADDAAGTGHEYHHRWWVNGHWRMQSCGPQHRERRATWVMPHVKGPEGAPMLPIRRRLILANR